MDDKIQVLITGKSDELNQALEQSAASVKTSTDQIATAANEAMGEVNASVAQASEAVEEHTRSMIHGVESLTESIEGVRVRIGVFGELATAVSELVLVGFGIEKVAEAFLKFGEQAEHLEHLSQVTGIAATKLSELGAIAELNGFSADEGNRGYVKLARSIAEADDAASPAARAFEALGINSKDLKNLSLDEVMYRVADAFKDSENGAAKAAIAQQLFGRNVEFWVSILNRGREGLKENGEEAQKLGTVMSKQDVVALESLAEGFSKAKAYAKGFFQEAIAGAVELYDRLVTNKAYYEELSTKKEEPKKELDFSPTKGGEGAQVKDFQKGLDLLLEGKKAYGEQATALELNYWRQILAIQGLSADDYAEVNKKIYELTGEQQRKATEDAKKAAEDQRRAQSEALQLGLSVLNAQREEARKGSQDRINIDREELAFARASAPERVDVQSRVQRQLTEDLRAQAKERMDIAQTEAESQVKAQVDGLNQQRAIMEIEVQAGIRERQDLLALDERLENERYQVEMEGLKKRLAIEAQEPAQQAKINAQIEALEREHVNKMQQLQLQLSTSGKIQQGFRGMMSNLTSTWASGLAQMIEKGFSWHNLMRGLFQSLEQAFLNMLANLVVQWITTQIEELVLGKATAASQIAANAAVAGSGAYAATAMIPYVGPFIAPGAAATAFAGALSYEGALSAAGGFDIPANLNPVTQLHAREMVLPAKYADVIRSLSTANGGPRNTYHYHAAPGESPESIMRNKSAFAAMAKQAHRSFAFR